MRIQKLDINKVLTEEQISQRVAEAEAQLHHYVYRSNSVWERVDSLNKTYAASNEPSFCKLVDTDAIIYFRELQDCGVSFPSWQDMITVGGETDLRLFLQIGRACYETVIKHIPKRAKTLRILDFGVGCGRTARHFFRDLMQYEVHGCDVDTAPIAYLRSNVPLIQAVVSSNEPPLPYAADYFDAIYSVSVFSHLNQTAFYAWADELSRVMMRGGVLIITIHGLTALTTLRSRQRPSSIGIDEEIFNSIEKDFDQRGFIWMPQTAGSGDIDVNQYGISFVDKKCLTSHLPTSLKIIHHGEGEIGGWQDLVVLEKL
jgi:SAM-dependent methyltransferase